MDTRKITFLCFIFLFVIMVSNYMSDEGFAAAQKKNYMSDEGFKSAAQKKIDDAKAAKKKADDAKKKAEAAKKAADAAAAETKKQLDEANKKLAAAAPGAVPGALPPALSASVSAASKLEFEKIMKDLNSIKTRMNTTASVIAKTASSINTTASSINTTASSVKKSETDTKAIAASLKSQLGSMTNSSKIVESAADNAITKISSYARTIENSVAANKKIGEDIDKKIVKIGDQEKNIKDQTDKASEIKNHIDKVVETFKKNSDQILADINLAANDFSAKKLTSTKQGFQNMDGVKPSAKSSAFTTIDTAYDGKMNLEGFSTTSDSAYLNNSDLFTLQQNVIASLKTFNEKYYGYQLCLRKNNYANDSCAITSGTDIGLNDVNSSKDAVITAVNAFNTAIVAMNAKSTLAPGENTSGKKMTQQEFQSRHNQIKETATRVSALRAELDMKMANLLDKTKGPLPEAQNKYNTENYVAIGWTILATSLVYYVFVEMK